MLAALLDCFKDQSWPVRDCACLACGHFVTTFPEESKALYPELKKLWIDHLSDNIQSLRENTAASIAEVLRGDFGDDMKEAVYAHISENLMKAKEQKEDSKKHAGLENVTQFGVAHEHHPAEDDGHSNNAMFSCGSLAPKLKRGGGCMDHGFTRPRELWELSDGAIFMLKELAQMDQHKEFVLKHVEGLSNLGYIDHFKHSHVLKENLFKSVAKVAQGLGKKPFRHSVELFLDPAFRNARNDVHRNMAVAAQDLLLAFERQYGQGIFKAIVESHDDRYVAEFNSYKE